MNTTTKSGMNPRQTILLIGAGLGGAALAQGLLAAGLTVRVFDRDGAPDARGQGFRISINATGYDALRALLPVDRFAQLRTIEVRDVGRGFSIASGLMKPLVRFGTSDDGATTVRRPALRRLLVEGVPVQWGKRLTAIKEAADGIEACFADGTAARGALIIGCDGVGSCVRAAMQGDDVPRVRPLNLRSIGGSVARTATWDQRLPLIRQGAAQFLGPGGRAMFVAFCERDDGTPTILWALSSRTNGDDEHWIALTDSPSGRAVLRSECAAALAHPGWHPDLRALVEQTRQDDMIDAMTFPTTTLRAKARAPWWPSGRVTLLGDAAHAMPPLRGLGGNTAFSDAQLLCGMLRTQGDRPLAELIADYERHMVKSAASALEDTMEMTRMCHFANPAAVAFRSAILRSLSLFHRIFRPRAS